MFALDHYYVADSRLALAELPTASVDLIVTDPPYGVNWKQTSYVKGKRAKIANDTPFESRELLRATMPELARVLKPGGSVYFFLPGGKTMFRQGSDLARVFEEHFDLRNVLIWDKTWIGMGWDYRYQYESIVFASAGKLACWEGGRAKSNILKAGRPKVWPGGHPTPKPVDLLAELIANSSRPGDLVLDPFAGSGAVAAAAKSLDRRFLAFDISSQWKAEAIDRHGLSVKELTIPNGSQPG